MVEKDTFNTVPKIANVYLFIGKEEFLKCEELNKIKDILTVNSKSIDYDTYYAGRADIKQILDSLKTPPLLSTKRLIVLKDIHSLPSSEVDLLSNCIKTTLKFSILILETDEENFHNNKLYNIVSQYGVIRIFRPLYDEELSRWISSRLKLYSKIIDADGLLALKENLGNNLNLIELTLEKLVDYTKDKKSISKEDVIELVGKSNTDTAFDLVDAIGQKNTPKALQILKGLLDAEKDPSEIIGLILWHIKRLKRGIDELLISGTTKEDVRKKLGVPAFAYLKFMNQVNNFKGTDFRRYFDMLLEADLVIKRSKFKTKTALELLIINLSSFLAE